MTPQILYQKALAKHSASWSGQQAMIRRIGRTSHTSLKIIQDALRAASAMYVKKGHSASNASNKIFRTIRPNNETPSDVIALYLQRPHQYGLNPDKNLLSWARKASFGTLLKMQSNSPDLSCVVLFERERDECIEHFKSSRHTKKTDDPEFINTCLMDSEWSAKQTLFVKSMMCDPNGTILSHIPFNVFNKLLQRSELEQQHVIEYLNYYPCRALFKSILSIDLSMFVVARSINECPETAAQAVEIWDSYAPTLTHMHRLAHLLDQQACNTESCLETLEILASAFGKTADQKIQAHALFKQFGPNLITYSMIFQTLYDQHSGIEPLKVTSDIFECNA